MISRIDMAEAREELTRALAAWCDDYRERFRIGQSRGDGVMPPPDCNIERRLLEAIERGEALIDASPVLQI